MLHHASLMRALETLEVPRWCFATDPVSCAAAEIESHVVNRFLSKMLTLGTCFAKDFANPLVRYRIKPTVKGGLVDHRDEGPVC